MIRSGPLRRIAVLAATVLSAAATLVGCYFANYCPPVTGGALNKLRLVGTWRLDDVGQAGLPAPFAAKPVNQALMIDGKTFLNFDLLGELKYVGTLGRDESIGLWEIDMQFRIAAIGPIWGVSGLGPMVVFNIRSSVVQKADGTVTVSMGWSQREANGTLGRDVTIVLDQMRSGATTEQVTAVMSVTESPLSSPAPPQTRLVGEVLLERINPQILEQKGDIHPFGRIQARGGPLPPYNDAVVFNTGQWFDLDATSTYGPNQPSLVYYWHVVREQEDPNTGAVLQRQEIASVSGVTSSFRASQAGKYYTTLFVTDGVLWRSTGAMGSGPERTFYVKVE